MQTRFQTASAFEKNNSERARYLSRGKIERTEEKRFKFEETKRNRGYAELHEVKG
jgi:hypothetical protein